jgi:hypothetical protein
MGRAARRAHADGPAPSLCGVPAGGWAPLIGTAADRDLRLARITIGYVVAIRSTSGRREAVARLRFRPPGGLGLLVTRASSELCQEAPEAAPLVLDASQAQRMPVGC